ncbi:MAG: hypothetical protein ACJA2S_003728, partial [Cyclobacteriaceae bacterium]
SGICLLKWLINLCFLSSFSSKTTAPSELISPAEKSTDTSMFPQ